MLKYNTESLSDTGRDFLAELALLSALPASFVFEGIIETHLSLILLGSTQVLKLRKPVYFDFVDHRNIKTRRASAWSELSLNRRLSADVYLGVLDYQRGQTLILDSALQDQAKDSCLGEPLVLMRRLAESDNVESLLLSGKDLTTSFKELGRILKAFHLQAALEIEPEKRVEFIETEFSLCQDNLKVLLANQQVLDEVRQGMLKRLIDYFEIKQQELGSLLRNNFLCVDGHGDLRLAHIYQKGEQLQVIDCIEFSAELRLLHPLNDIAFLCMDCLSKKHGALAAALLQGYGMTESRSILQYFLFYRALVRAKIEALSLKALPPAETQEHQSELQRLLGLATRFTFQDYRPFVIVCCGLIASGKSFLSELLSSALDIPKIESDLLRREMFGPPETQQSQAWEEGRYSKANKQAVYTEVHQQMEKHLKNQNPVIIDASFSNLEQREALRTACKVPVFFLWCQVPLDVAKERIAQRQRSSSTNSEATAENLLQQLAVAEVPTGESDVCVLDTNQLVSDLMQETLRCLVRLGKSPG